MRLTVSSSPHIKSGASTAKIMGDVLIALIPSIVAACWFFGLRALLVVLFSMALCVGLEALSRLVMKRDNTVHDGSAAVTGVLLALSLPADIPLHYLLVGCVVAIVVVKQMFGGLGCNFVNPALTARIVMLVSFPAETVGRAHNLALPDGITSATPLSGGDVSSLLDLFLGRVADKGDKRRLMFFAAATLAVGLLLMYFFRGMSHGADLVLFGIGGLVMISGYIFILALSGALVRDNTPVGEAGKLQGVRMVFSVLIPMLVGPTVGNAINRVRAIPLPNAGADAMTTEYIPAPEIFLAAAGVTLLIFAIIPLLYKVEKADKNEG